MSELLKTAIEAVTKLSDADQDEVARMMLAMSADGEIVPVPPDHLEAVAQGLAQARRSSGLGGGGQSRLAPL